jgi:excisionase family DNA binding protein
LAIREGLLKAEDPSKIARTDLDDWLQQLQFRAGQSHHQDLLSLKAAAQQANVSLGSLRRAISKGELATESNPAGQPLVVPVELQRWLAARPGSDPARLESGQHYRLREIAELTHMKLATVQRDVVKGLLKASLMAGAPPYHLVREADFIAWLRAREQKYSQPKLKGEMLSTRQACEKYGVTSDILLGGRKSGRLQVARRFAANGVALFYSSQEIEQYLKQRNGVDDAWTRTRIAEFFGINAEAVREAMLRGSLPFEMRDFPGKGPRRCVSLENLVLWVHRQAPPYRAEMAHLGHFVSYKTAAELAGRPPSAIHAALRSGELPGLNWGTEDTGYHIPRYQFDLWLARQGLPPSWELETDTRWLRVQDAAELAQVATPTIQKWLTAGYLVAQRRGRRWLVDRESLLKVADQYRANLENPKGNHLTVARVAELTGLSRVIIEQAVEREELQASALRQPGISPLWVIDTQSLIQWLETQAPPYRKEVSQLSPFVSSKVAGKLTGLGQTSVVKALRAGEFGAISVQQKSGPRYYIPRCQFDKWLKNRGLPPSWEPGD